MHFLIYHRGCKANWANVANYSQQVPWGIRPIAISEMNSVTYSNVNFICTRFRRQTAVCVRSNCGFWNWMQVWKQCQRGRRATEWHGETRHSRVTGVRKSSFIPKAISASVQFLRSKPTHFFCHFQDDGFSHHLGLWLESWNLGTKTTGRKKGRPCCLCSN